MSMAPQGHRVRGEAPRRAGAAPGSGQSGQAMVESALMLCLLAACLMFLVVTANLVQDMIKAQEGLRHDIRTEAARSAPGPFHRVDKTRRVNVEAPGIIGKSLGQERIRLDIGLTSYAGTYQGYGMTEYTAYKSLRLIRE